MSKEIIDLFKDSYRDLITLNLSKLDLLYTNDLVFKDPIHEIRGLVAMQDYMADISDNLLECRFHFLDQLESETSAYIKWDMHYAHPKLAGGKLITLRGASQIQFAERIYYHEDIYDMGSMVYEHLPLLGAATRWVKRRLSS